GCNTRNNHKNDQQCEVDPYERIDVNPPINLVGPFGRCPFPAVVFALHNAASQTEAPVLDLRASPDYLVVLPALRTLTSLRHQRQGTRSHPKAIQPTGQGS